MSRNNKEVENKKLFKPIELEIEENFKSEVNKRYNIYNHLKNNASEIVSKASKEFLAEKPKLIAKGGIIYHPRDMIVFLRDMDWLFKIVIYSIFQKVQPTQLSVFESVLKEVVKDSAIKKLSKQDTTFAIKTLEETARSSLNEEPVVDSDFTELLEKHFKSLKNFFLNFSFDEESLDAGEKNTADSPDQNLEEKVMEKDLMDLPEEDFIKKVSSLTKQALQSSENYHISLEKNFDILYEYQTAKNRGKLSDPKREENFVKSLMAKHKIAYGTNPFSKEVRSRFRALMLKRINSSK